MATITWPRRFVVAVAVVAFATLAYGAGASASHWAFNGWTDKHLGYPPKPNGLSQINSTFGSACNSDANDNSFYWVAADNGVSYNLVFHRKLGTNGWSTNLDNDVRGHIGNSHLDPYVRSGIWGYNCRYISGTSKYSTHAWGIAVDQNSAYEHYGHAHNHTVHAGVVDRFGTHGWSWGLSFNDAMHFQYADGY